MKILFWNLGYARHLSGSAKEWLLYGHQVLYHPKADQLKQLDTLIEVVKRITPDVFAYAEVVTGSFRNQFFNQPAYLAEKLSCVSMDAESKYSSSLLAKLPFHSGNTNGICVSLPGSLENGHLKSGGKTLVQKIIVNDWLIYTVHLSLIFSIRKRQLAELAEAICAAPEIYNIVVCGDFNTLRGNTELGDLLSRTGLVLESGIKNTFPAHRPTRQLDYVLYRLKEERRVTIEILPDIISDHRPVLCTFS